MKPRLLFTPIAAALAALILYLAIAGIGKADDPPAPQIIEIDRIVQGYDVDQWHAIAARYLNAKRQLAHAIHFDPEVRTAIGLACTVYGYCSTLWRKADCESHLARFAMNRSSHASGLFQFLPSTWASTPYGRFSVFDPYANALAAGWMHRAGRGSEWVCR